MLSWPGRLTYSGRLTHICASESPDFMALYKLVFNLTLTYKWSPVSYRSSAGQRKFTGQRTTFYHCATQPTATAECPSRIFPSCVFSVPCTRILAGTAVSETGSVRRAWSMPPTYPCRMNHLDESAPQSSGDGKNRITGRRRENR